MVEPKKLKSDFSELAQMVQSAVARADKLEVDELLLTWPELPPSLKNSPPKSQSEK